MAKLDSQEHQESYKNGYKAAIIQACSYIMRDFWYKTGWMDACKEMFPTITDELLDEIHKQEVEENS